MLQSASVLQAPGSALHMLSATDFHTLTDVSERYLMQEDYGVPEVENIMVRIFSTNRIGGEAEAWTKYWRELNIYEEQLHSQPKPLARRRSLASNGQRRTGQRRLLTSNLDAHITNLFCITYHLAFLVLLHYLALYLGRLCTRLTH